jgi:hypothetical protein
MVSPKTSLAASASLILYLTALSQNIRVVNALLFKKHYLQYGEDVENPQYRSCNTSFPDVTLHRRASSKLVTTLTTKSFKILLTCDTPFGDTKGEICTKVGNAFKRAATRLERVIFLSDTVTINAHFKSLCGTNLTAYGQPCGFNEKTLGYASTAAWHQFTPDAAVKLGLDSDYLYPTSLARQFARNSDEIKGITVDINAVFNSDWNWWFSTPGDELGYLGSGKWGPPVAINGGFFGQSQTYSYDFEQVATHELIHGMGWTSSWQYGLGDYIHYVPGVSVANTGFRLGLSNRGRSRPYASCYI